MSFAALNDELYLGQIDRTIPSQSVHLEILLFRFINFFLLRLFIIQYREGFGHTKFGEYMPENEKMALYLVLRERFFEKCLPEPFTHDILLAEGYDTIRTRLGAHSWKMS